MWSGNSRLARIIGHLAPDINFDDGLTRIRNILGGYQVTHNKSFPTNMRASILIPIVMHDGQMCFLLTVRSSNLKYIAFFFFHFVLICLCALTVNRDHPGEVAFPGGKQDPTDQTSLDTALREAKEEVGLEAEQCEILGEIDQSTSKKGQLVSSFVGVISDDFEAKYQQEEVERVFYVPFASFLESECWTLNADDDFLFAKFYYKDSNSRSKAAPILIFGLTLMLCVRLLDLLEFQLPCFPSEEFLKLYEKWWLVPDYPQLQDSQPARTTRDTRNKRKPRL
jgi:8-oxo-dGTP pyrophosphatase MutT (NUDIX family)